MPELSDALRALGRELWDVASRPAVWLLAALTRLLGRWSRDV